MKEVAKFKLNYDTIKSAPAYDESKLISPNDQIELFGYYGKKFVTSAGHDIPLTSEL